MEVDSVVGTISSLFLFVGSYVRRLTQVAGGGEGGEGREGGEGSGDEYGHPSVRGAQLRSVLFSHIVPLWETGFFFFFF